MVVAALMLARTGTVLINRPTIESAPATSSGRPDTAVPKATLSALLRFPRLNRVLVRAGSLLP